MGTHGRGGGRSSLVVVAMSFRAWWLVPVCVLLLATVAVREGSALQRHTLLPEQTGEQQAPGAGQVQPQTPLATSQASGDFHGVPATQTAAPDAGQGAAVLAPQGPGHGEAATKQAPAAAPGAAKGQAVAPGPVAQPTPEPAHVEAQGEHGPALPVISPTPGVTFVETMIDLMEYELDGRFLGWRPNDIILGRFTDNVNNFQLGVLEAIRFTTLRLKDSLTRMGDADTYDPDLELAVNFFMNRSTLFWFPSAETSYGEGVQHLKGFVTKLKGGQRNFYYRVDNLRLLLASYKDLLGNVNRSLIVSPVSMFKTDDYFYYAKGIAHVYYQILRVVRVGYEKQLASTMNGIELMDEIIHELHRVEELDPWIVLDSDLDGFFANHRANLNAPLSEVMHLLGILSTF